jgi:hypothetical protein
MLEAYTMLVAGVGGQVVVVMPREDMEAAQLTLLWGRLILAVAAPPVRLGDQVLLLYLCPPFSTVVK